MSLILTKPSGTAMVRGDAQSGLRTSGQACHGWIERLRSSGMLNLNLERMVKFIK